MRTILKRSRFTSDQILMQRNVRYFTKKLETTT